MSVQKVSEDGLLEAAMEEGIPLLMMPAEPLQASRQSAALSRMTESNDSTNVRPDVLNVNDTTNDEKFMRNEKNTFSKQISNTNDIPAEVNEADKEKNAETGDTSSMEDDDTNSSSKANKEMDVALRDAIRNRDVEAARQLLVNGAPLTCRDDAQMTPLHLCIQQYCYWNYEHNIPGAKCRPREMEIIRLILGAAMQTEVKSEILDSLDRKGRSPLYLAIECGYFDVVEALLESEANVRRVSDKDASAVQRIDILKYFLENYDIENSADVDGYTVIHTAAKFNVVESFKLLLRKYGHEAGKQCTKDGSTVLHVAAEYGSYAVVKFLLRTPYYACKDDNGETPLNRSAKQGHKSVTALLLSHGAVLSDKGPQGSTAAEQIVRRFANPIKFFEDVFDECIIENESSAMCKARKVHIDYKALANSDGTGMSQIKVVEELVRCGQKDILIHPLIESLLFLKWRCLLPVVYTIVVIYAIFLISLNAFIVTMFYKRDYYNTSYCTNFPNKTLTLCFDCFDGLSWTWFFFIYFSICLLLGQEYVHIYLKGRRYLVHRESWGKLLLLVLAAVVPACVRCSEPTPWLRHTASATLLLSWVQAMLLLSRFPDWGYYVLMFERVTYNIFKILLTSIFLVIAFSFSFMIEYHSESPFDGPTAAFVKTIVMMSSEFDYEDLFSKDHTELQDTMSIVRFLFVIFVIFIAIVLMNFMIGVAVNDINELNKIGNIRRLEKQVELQSTLDALIDSALQKIFNRDSFKNPSGVEDPEIFRSGPFFQYGSIIKRLFRIKYHHNISKDIESDEKWKVWFGVSSYFVDDYEQTIPPELQNDIINVARSKVQKKYISNVKNEKENKLNAMYNTLIGADIPAHQEAIPSPNYNNSLNTADVTLKEKINSLEHSNKIMAKSIDDITKKMNLMLECMAKLENRRNVGMHSKNTNASQELFPDFQPEGPENETIITPRKRDQSTLSSNDSLISSPAHKVENGAVNYLMLDFVAFKEETRTRLLAQELNMQELSTNYQQLKASLNELNSGYANLKEDVEKLHTSIGNTTEIQNITKRIANLETNKNQINTNLHLMKQKLNITDNEILLFCNSTSPYDCSLTQPCSALLQTEGSTSATNEKKLADSQTTRQKETVKRRKGKHTNHTINSTTSVTSTTNSGTNLPTIKPKETYKSDTSTKKLNTKEKKSKLCFLSNHKNMGTVQAIDHSFEERVEYCHYTVPDGEIEDHFDTLDSKLTNFTSNDYCIIFLGESDVNKYENGIELVNNIRESLKEITHTNKILCLPTYVCGAPIYNYKVEMFNNLLTMDMQTNKYAYIFDTNRDLTKSRVTLVLVSFLNELVSKFSQV